jgi:hypothetical protein
MHFALFSRLSQLIFHLDNSDHGTCRRPYNAHGCQNREGLRDQFAGRLNRTASVTSNESP